MKWTVVILKVKWTVDISCFQAGPIEKVILKEDNNGCPQHALIIFKYTDSVVWSLNNLNFWVLCGQQISIRPLRLHFYLSNFDNYGYMSANTIYITLVL